MLGSSEKSKSFLKKKFLIIGVVCLLCLSACGTEEKSESNGEVKNFCKQYASEYTVIESESDKCVVSVEAPDFQKIVEIMLEEGKEDISAETLEETIEKNSDCKKEYIVSVESEEMDVIEEAFLEQVSYELMVAAIKDVEYEEKWSVEE